MAKTKRKNKAPSRVWTKYTLEGGVVKRKRMCPKCGPGMFLAQHKDRWYCGKCHFVEMVQKGNS